MIIRIERPTIDDWVKHLKRAGPREIGGVLFGEQLDEGCFRIVEATRQRFWPATHDRFCRKGTQARKDILSLHRRYCGQAQRFNYLGEWHSHPSAPVVPSLCDEMTMASLLAEQAGAVNFLVLVVVRFSYTGVLEIGAHAYLASGHILVCEVETDRRELNDND